MIINKLVELSADDILLNHDVWIGSVNSLYHALPTLFPFSSISCL
jgi:hypothetical protein